MGALNLGEHPVVYGDVGNCGWRWAEAASKSREEIAVETLSETSRAMGCQVMAQTPQVWEVACMKQDQAAQMHGYGEGGSAIWELASTSINGLR